MACGDRTEAEATLLRTFYTAETRPSGDRIQYRLRLTEIWSDGTVRFVVGARFDADRTDPLPHRPPAGTPHIYEVLGDGDVDGGWRPTGPLTWS